MKENQDVYKAEEFHLVQLYAAGEVAAEVLVDIFGLQRSRVDIEVEVEVEGEWEVYKVGQPQTVEWIVLVIEDGWCVIVRLIMHVNKKRLMLVFFCFDFLL